MKLQFEQLRPQRHSSLEVAMSGKGTKKVPSWVPDASIIEEIERRRRPQPDDRPQIPMYDYPPMEEDPRSNPRRRQPDDEDSDRGVVIIQL